MKRLLFLGASGFVGKCFLNDLTVTDSFEVVRARRGVQSFSNGEISADVMKPLTVPGPFDVIIHAATPASATLNHGSPLSMFDNCVTGMRNVLNYAERLGNCPLILFTSSGAVYGDMPGDMTSFEEDCRLAPASFDPKSAYAEGKRAAEFLLAEAANRGVCVPRLARLFAFSGTLLPVDRHFAIGNFVRDAVNQQTIEVRGDGKAIRSYLDQDDLAEWLLAIILRGLPTSTYHIGSERAISIADLAHLVANRYEAITSKSCTVEVKGQTSPLDGVNRYVPSTAKTRSELNLQERVSLEDSIDKMIRAHLRD